MSNPEPIKPEILEAMTRVELALGSPQYPRFPLLDAMFALAHMIGHHETTMARDPLSTWKYVEAGFEMIPEEDSADEHNAPNRTPIPINLEMAYNAIQREVEASEIPQETWINLLANVLGQLCAIEGVEISHFQPVIETAYQDKIQTAEA